MQPQACHTCKWLGSTCAQHGTAWQVSLCKVSPPWQRALPPQPAGVQPAVACACWHVALCSVRLVPIPRRSAALVKPHLAGALEQASSFLNVALLLLQQPPRLAGGKVWRERKGCETWASLAFIVCIEQLQAFEPQRLGLAGHSKEQQQTTQADRNAAPVS